jgi:hypothetical protein
MTSEDLFDVDYVEIMKQLSIPKKLLLCILCNCIFFFLYFVLYKNSFFKNAECM